MNILLPTDFSPNAQYAVDQTLRQFDIGNTHFLMYHSVVQPRSYGGMLVNITDIMLNDAKTQLNNEVKRLQSMFGSNLKIKTLARVGYLSDMLPIIVRTELVDLVAMGSQGATDLAAKFLGSNTEQVIRQSTIPVLAIPKSNFDITFKNVVIATEKSTLNHTKWIEKIFTSLAYIADMKALTILTDENARAEKSIECNGHFLPVEVLKAPKAIEGIHQYLKSNTVDLLVLYHQQNTRLDYLFKRSITKKITGTMPVPLLILPR